MTILRLLKWQGLAGIAAILALGLLLLIQKGETSHWRKQSATFEQRYRQDQATFAATVANYRAAAADARAADKANAERVAVEQRTINERTSSVFESRLAAARSVAQRLRRDAATAAIDPSARRAAPVPSLSLAPGGSPQAPDEDRLFVSDRELATDQAIQLDELIKWVKKQAAVDPNEGARRR